MSEPFIGEVRLFSGNYAPVDWAFCDGRNLRISDYEMLFSLIGTTYGGDGVQYFNLPDLRGRVPVHQSSNYPLGMKFGTETVTLATAELPPHTHSVTASSQAASQGSPSNGVVAATTLNSYDSANASQAMSNAAVDYQGGNQPHNNIAPYQAVNYIIALIGVYPIQG